MLIFPYGIQRTVGRPCTTLRRVARYHLVMRGQCWIYVDGNQTPIQLHPGDLLVVPHGASHDLKDAPETEVEELDRAIEQSGFNGEGCFVYGGEDTDCITRLLCGHFEFSPHIEHPLLDALPQYIHVPARVGIDYSWLDDALKLIVAEITSGDPGSQAIVKRLSEIIFIQTVRELRNRSDIRFLNFEGYTDSQISHALHAIHKAPGEKWTVAALSRIAYLSRTQFAVKFKRLIGQTPLEYVTQWRMQLARPRVIAGSEELLKIALDLGYKSEAAFSRAFSRYFGASPTRYRKLFAKSGQHLKSKLAIKRVYEPRDKKDGFRVLVDRLWPRGIKKADIDLWFKDLAPSAELRRWYGHDDRKWREFRRRYRRELLDNNLEDIVRLLDTHEQTITLLYAAKTAKNNATVLAELITSL